jgi:hypothetical protein
VSTIPHKLAAPISAAKFKTHSQFLLANAAGASAPSNQDVSKIRQEDGICTGIEFGII